MEDKSYAGQTCSPYIQFIPSLPSAAAQGNKEVHTESGEHLRAKNHKLLTGKNLQDHLVLTDEVTRTQ